mgnify:CR=1 FL=1
MSMILTLAIAALIPLIVGFIYYNKNVFGNSWAAMTGIEMGNPEEMKKAMPKIMVISYIVSFLMAFALSPFVIHQMGLFSLLQGSMGNLTEAEYAAKIAVSFDGTPIDPNKLWNEMFRTFGHGALHGTMFGVFMALPMIITMGLYEKRPWKLMLINGGYWIINFALMGGFICQMIKW